MTGNKGIMFSLDSTCFLSVSLAHGSTSFVQGIELVNTTSSLSLSSVQTFLSVYYQLVRLLKH